MVGLYVHIPFCASKCKYCDFVSYPDKEELIPRYVDAVMEEAKSYSGEVADTVFFGGGTPARLPLKEMTRLFEGITKSIKIAENAELTIEVNPNSADFEKLKEYRQIGVNRLSIGLQAAQERLLKGIGRTHTLADFLNTVENAKKAGFKNISADMMYSLPGQTVKDCVETAKLLAGLKLQHVSAYALILEEGTPLYDENPVLPSDETDREMFYAIRDVLNEAGIQRYEISNFAKAGYECAHNLKYWRVEDYIGLGAAAHSCYKGKRFSNAGSLFGYLAKEKGESEPQEPIKERIMLKLRLTEGIKKEELPQGEVLQRLINEGLAFEKEGRFILTDKGLDLQNYVVSELFDCLK